MMQVVINVDEKLFENTFNTELNNFPKEELKNIIRDAFSEYLKNNIEKVFFSKDTRYYADKNALSPNQILYDAAKTLNLRPAFEQVQQGLIETLENNYPEILRSVLSYLIIKGITEEGNFVNVVRETILSTLYQMNIKPGGN